MIEKKEYKIECVLTMRAIVVVTAASEEEAIEKFNKGYFDRGDDEPALDDWKIVGEPVEHT
jgi:hypothetical protein